MKVSRRQVVIAGGCGLAAGWLVLAPGPAVALGAQVRPTLFVVDTSLARAEQAIASAKRAGVPRAHFAGDIGDIWHDELVPLSRGTPIAVAGYTTAGALFCLEHLLRGSGLTCSKAWPSTAGDRDDPASPLPWLLGPASAMRADGGALP